MSFENEFEVVDLIINSDFKTSCVDAFALSLIKSERQMRRLFTYLVYQSAAFKASDINKLKSSLSDNRDIYFNELEKGFNLISKYSTKDLIGNDYSNLKEVLNKSTKYRNKIFHGQLTNQNLSRDDLLPLVENTKQWCKLLSSNALDKIGYDGFIRNSFRKYKGKSLSDIVKIEFTSIEGYNEFLNSKVAKKRKIVAK